MNIIGFFMVMLAAVLVGGVIANRQRRLNEKHIHMLAIVAILEVTLAFFAGLYLMVVS